MHFIQSVIKKICEEITVAISILSMSNQTEKKLYENSRPAENTLLPIIEENANTAARVPANEPGLNSGSDSIPIIEERVVVDKRIVETGKVLISKRVSEHEEIVDEPLLHEQVSVERVAVNQFVEEHPEIRHHGETMIIPVVEERLVVSKRLFLVEELHVKKQVIETHQPQQIILLKTEVDVKRST